MIVQPYSVPKQYCVSLPLRVDLSKRSHVSLNLNWYRNAHYQTLNTSKIIFKEQIWEQIKNLPYFTAVKLKYVIYPQTKRLFDLANVGSIVDKYFCDAMTEAERWEDDNYTVVKNVTYSLGQVDKENPRVEVYITEYIDIEDKPMRITLDQSDIDNALSEYLQKNFNICGNQITSIEYNAGRNGNGLTGCINLSNKEAEITTKVSESEEKPVQSTSVQEPVQEVTGNPDFKKIFG